eukprot:646597-Rhodomonas_salina.2
MRNSSSFPSTHKAPQKPTLEAFHAHLKPHPPSHHLSPVPTLSSPSRHRKSTSTMHIKLSEQQVLEIYSYRPLPDGCERSPLAGRSSELSRIYGISTKAIRDIWNLRSWAHVTQKDLEPEARVAAIAEAKAVLAVRQPPGRPMLLKEAAKSKSRKRSRGSSEEEEGDDTRTGAALFEVLLDLAKRRRKDDPHHAVSSPSTDGGDAKDSKELPALNPNSVLGQALPLYGFPSLTHDQNLKPHELQM